MASYTVTAAAVWVTVKSAAASRGVLVEAGNPLPDGVDPVTVERLLAKGMIVATPDEGQPAKPVRAKKTDAAASE